MTPWPRDLTDLVQLEVVVPFKADAQPESLRQGQADAEDPDGSNGYLGPLSRLVVDQTVDDRLVAVSCDRSQREDAHLVAKSRSRSVYGVKVRNSRS